MGVFYTGEKGPNRKKDPWKIKVGKDPWDVNKPDWPYSRWSQLSWRPGETFTAGEAAAETKRREGLSYYEKLREDTAGTMRRGGAWGANAAKYGIPNNAGQGATPGTSRREYLEFLTHIDSMINRHPNALSISRGALEDHLDWLANPASSPSTARPLTGMRDLLSDPGLPGIGQMTARDVLRAGPEWRNTPFYRAQEAERIARGGRHPNAPSENALQWW